MPIFQGSCSLGWRLRLLARYVARRNHAATTAATGPIFATTAALLVAGFGPGGFRTTDYLLGAHQGLPAAALALLYRGLPCHRSLWCPQSSLCYSAQSQCFGMFQRTTSSVVGGVVVALFGLLVTTLDPALGIEYGKELS